MEELMFGGAGGARRLAVLAGVAVVLAGLTAVAGSARADVIGFTQTQAWLGGGIS
jgi:hypothetical protein